MGLNIKRKFFGIDKFENYLRISKLNFIITNNFTQDKEAYYNIEFRISLNSEARDIEKISSQIINKQTNIDIKNSAEQQQMDNFLTGYNDQNGFGELGAITITIPIWQLLKKYEIHPLFKEYKTDDIFNFFYNLFSKEYKGYLGIESEADITINQENDIVFKDRMTSQLQTTLKKGVNIQ